MPSINNKKNKIKVVRFKGEINNVINFNFNKIIKQLKNIIFNFLKPKESYTII